jgi:hypothetical protein
MRLQPQQLLSSFKIARATYRFVWGNRLECLRILWLPLLLIFCLAWIVWPHIVPFVKVSVPSAGTSISGSSSVALALWLLLLFAGLTVLSSIMCAGLWRLILRNVHVTGPYYLGFGSDELRLLMLAGLMLLLFLAWGLVTAVVIFLIELVASHFSGSFSPPAFLLTLLIALSALGWIGTRLGLSGSASIKTQRVDLASSWRDTAHNVARIRLVAALLTVPAVVVILVLLLLLLFLLIHWLNILACVNFLARLKYLLPLLLPVLYFLVLFLSALYLTACALEYKELSTP